MFNVATLVPYRQNPATCRQCSIKEDACPACLNVAKRTPGHAVRIVNVPVGLAPQAMFRYGPNSFKLHRLPTPRAGSVLGLIGTNGIGKTTALKIFSGKLKPNLGDPAGVPWAAVLAQVRSPHRPTVPPYDHMTTPPHHHASPPPHHVAPGAWLGASDVFHATGGRWPPHRYEATTRRPAQANAGELQLWAVVEPGG